MTYVINPRVDALLTILDRERDRLQLTNGELIAFNVVALAGLLEQSGNREMLTDAIGFLLAYVSRRENASNLFEQLKQTCGIDNPSMPES